MTKEEKTDIITNVLVEINSKIVPIKELPQKQYEEFLDMMHKLRLGYITILNKQNEQHQHSTECGGDLR